MDDCMNALDCCTIQDFIEFRKGLHSVYCFSNLNEFYMADLPNLESLVEYLRKANYDSHAKNINRQWLISKLENDIQNLQKQKTKE